MVHLVGGRRGIVAAQYLWNAAQGPKGCLQYLPQGQEGLTGGDLSVASSPNSSARIRATSGDGTSVPVAPLAIHGSPTIRSAMAESCPTFFRTYNLTNPPKRRNLVNICVLRAINWIAYHDINGRANLSQVKIMHHHDLQPLTAAQRAALPPLEELPTHPYAQLLPPAPPEQFELLGASPSIG